jgi:hypothetical protein
MIERISYRGWDNAYKLANGEVELLQARISRKNLRLNWR